MHAKLHSEFVILDQGFRTIYRVARPLRPTRDTPEPPHSYEPLFEHSWNVTLPESISLQLFPVREISTRENHKLCVGGIGRYRPSVRLSMAWKRKVR